MLRLCSFWIVLWVLGCASRPLNGTASRASSGPIDPGLDRPRPDAAPAPVPASEALATQSSNSARPCGRLSCLEFPSIEAAFDRVLLRSPRVLAVGEVHALKGVEAIPSATHRFAQKLLPRLKGRASDLLIELWTATGACGKVEEQVARQQAPVTQGQAPQNQAEFLTLGHRAKALGIRPHALVPSCDEYRAIAGAGASDVDRMLQMVADATRRDLEELLSQAPTAPDSTLIVAYGGALHNDLVPRPGRERWSFGPAIQRATAGRYVELDLIVPEFIRDTESFRAQPWYTPYQEGGSSNGARLYRTGENSFVLIFPRWESANQGPTGSCSCRAPRQTPEAPIQ